MKWTITFILAINLFVDCETNEELFSLKYQITLGSFFLYIYFGEPNQLLFEEMDQSLPYSWTNELYYLKSRSQTYKIIGESTIKYLGFDERADVLNETITFRNNKSITFKFKLLPSKTIPKQYGGFSFAFRYDDEQYSIIHQLKHNNLITKLAYSIVPDYPIKNEGTFYLGGIPSNHTINKQKASCKVKNDDYTWGCMLQSVSLGDNIHHYNSYSIFQAKGDLISLPFEFISNFNRTFFKPYFNSNQCYITGKHYETILCDENIIDSFFNISFTFTFNDFDLIFPLKDLFGKSINKRMKFNIQYNTQYEEKIVFGSVFFKELITVFDYENESVTFYKDDGIKHHLNMKVNEKHVNVIEYFLMCLLVIGIIVLIYLKNKIEAKRMTI